MILRYLNQRYPVVDNLWKVIIPISLFVCLFMIIFQPFGLSDYAGSDKYILLAGYGLVTLVILLFDLFLIPALFPAFFRDENWVVWKELLILLWILFTIGLANLFYTTIFFHIRFSISSIVLVQLYTLAIGIIPVTTLTIVKQNYLHRKHRLSADQLSSHIPHRKKESESSSQVKFVSDNGKDEISLSINDLSVIDAEGNYITLFHTQDEKPQSILLRNTLSYAEEIVSSFPSLYKCHRSFLVNLDRVTKVNGNSQGYRLVVSGVPDEIPVSRSNTIRLKELLST